MKTTSTELQNEIFQFVDDAKDLLSPTIWNNILMDCSKNEALVLWLLFRQTNVTMTMVAEYIGVPLNTATGIVTRMEHKKLVERTRSAEDKRVVTLALAPQGSTQMQSIMKECTYYLGQLVTAFSQEELELLFRMMKQILEILNKERQHSNEETPKVRKITIE